MQPNQQTKRYLCKSNCFQAKQNLSVCYESHSSIDITNGIDIYTYHYLKQQNKLTLFSTQAKPSAKNQAAGIASQAFGKRDQNLSDDVVIDEVKRGFTSHEHIDELGLINMNARLYDPQTARFLSADSFIQDSNLTLSHNRYIYVMNNPLKYTDPSGHFWNFIVGAIISYAASQSDNPFIRTLGMIAGGAMMGGAFGGESLFASTLHTKMAAGFVMGGINGGDAQGAILGAMSAGLTYGIGHGGEIDAITGETTSYFDSFVGTAVAHGTAQGLIAEASGGSFQSGFAAGFSGHLAGGLSGSLIGKVGNNTDFVSVVSRTTIAATIGGLAAQATGGNFEDGAYQAAMVHLFNFEWDKIGTATPKGKNKFKGKRYFKTEPRNTNILSFSDGFYYTARGYQIDNYGKIIPSVASPNWGKYTSGYDAVIDVGRPSQYGNRLNININTRAQPSNGNSNTNGWYINVYTSD